MEPSELWAGKSIAYAVFQWAQKTEHKNTDDGGLACEVSKYLKDSIRAIQFGELKILLQLGLKNQQ